MDVSWRADLAADEHDFLWSESQLVELVVWREPECADPQSDLSTDTGLRTGGYRVEVGWSEVCVSSLSPSPSSPPIPPHHHHHHLTAPRLLYPHLFQLSRINNEDVS